MRSFFGVWLIVLSISLTACSYVPVQEVKRCSNIVKVELLREYILGIPSLHKYIRLTLADGSYAWNDNLEYYRWGIIDLESATKIKMGKEYCQVKYEPVK